MTPIEITGLFVCETEEFKVPFFFLHLQDKKCSVWFVCSAHDFHKESIYFCPTENCSTGQMCFPDVPMQLQYVEFSGLTLRRKL